MSVLSNEALVSVKSNQNIQIFPKNNWYLYPYFILFSLINKHVDKLHQTEFKREIFVFQIRIVCIYLEYSSSVVIQLWKSKANDMKLQYFTYSTYREHVFYIEFKLAKIH